MRYTLIPKNCVVLRDYLRTAFYTHSGINCSKISEALTALLFKFHLLGCYNMVLGK
jgi:hypothetical protein